MASLTGRSEAVAELLGAARLPDGTELLVVPPEPAPVTLTAPLPRPAAPPPPPPGPTG